MTAENIYYHKKNYMAEINNLDIIKPLLKFPTEDTFYFVQVLIRKKDGTAEGYKGNNNGRLIKAYYIKSIEHLETFYPEMTKLATTFNARVMINLNPRGFERSSFMLLQRLAEQMSMKNYDNIHRQYNMVCGEMSSSETKIWLVDIDTQDYQSVRHYIVELHRAVNDDSCKGPTYKILEIIPSRSGFHILTHPFRLEKFKEKFPDIEVHKNNPTNLYIPMQVTG